MSFPTLLYPQSAEPKWDLSFESRYLSRYTNLGVDLSQNNPAYAFSGSIAHSMGLSAGYRAVRQAGSSGGFVQSSFELDYERSLTETLTFSAGYSRYTYANDSVNAFAQLKNSFSLGLDVDLDPVGLTFSYDRYTGNRSASYYGLSLSTFTKWNNILIVPLVQANLVSQTVETRLLKSGKGSRGGPPVGISGSSTKEMTGISNLSILCVFSYPLFKDLRLSLIPAYHYTPTELSSWTSKFVWTVALKYSFRF